MKKGRQSELRNLCCAGLARKWQSKGAGWEGGGPEGRKQGSEHGRTVPGMTVPPAELAVFHLNGTPIGKMAIRSFSCDAIRKTAIVFNFEATLLQNRIPSLCTSPCNPALNSIKGG